MRYATYSLLASLILFQGSALSAEVTSNLPPPNTPISNQAIFFYRSSEATDVLQAPSEVVTLTIQEIAAIEIQRDTQADGSAGRTVLAEPGDWPYIEYTIINNGNTPDRLIITPNNSAPLAGIFVDQNANNLIDAYEHYDLENDLTDGKFTTHTLQPGEQTTVWFQYHVPENTPPGRYATVDPTGVSLNSTKGMASGTGQGLTATDSGNLGEVVVKEVTVGTVYELTASPEIMNQPYNYGNPVTFNHEITNSGNANITSDQIAINQDPVPDGYTAVFTANCNNTAAQTSTVSLEAAVKQAILVDCADSFQPGTSIITSVALTTKTGTVTGTTMSFTPFLRNITENPPAVVNNGKEGDYILVTTIDEPVVTEPTVTKHVGSCERSTDTCPSASSIRSDPAPPTTVVPGECISYVIDVVNSGQTPIFKPILDDPTPLYFMPSRVGSFASPEIIGSKMLYGQPDGSWSADSMNVTSLSGTLIRLGYDSNGDDTIDDTDVLRPGQTITTVIQGCIYGFGPTIDLATIPPTPITINNSIASP